MEIERTLELDAPTAHVWDILGGQYTDVGAWTIVINHSEAVDGVALPGAPAYGRVCDTPDGVFKEKIVQFDEERFVLEYHVEEGLPFFVRQGGNTWSLEPLDGGRRTRVRMKMQFLMPAVMELAMGWMLRKQMSKAGDTFLGDLKVYAEKGEVSEKKRQRLAAVA